MKFSFHTLTLFLLLQLAVFGQATYQGLPLIEAGSENADYRIGNEWVRDSWSIAPQIEYDSLFVYCFPNKTEEFVFYTDRDSIRFTLSRGEVHSFYVLINDRYARTVICGVKPEFTPLGFDTVSVDGHLKFWYEQNKENPFLEELRTKFPVDELVKNAKNDTEKALSILHWVHLQWQHNGDNQPRKSDAISILEEAGEGKNFRCVEYGIVATACLNAVGLKARTLALKTKNVETTPYGAGHVLLEVYLDDLNKWALLDGQWDAVPVLDGLPLNAVEFQQAISENYDRLEIWSYSEPSKRHYINWIYPYLYYFDVSFDNRENRKDDRHAIDGKTSLMLVPAGAKSPTIFQLHQKIDDCIYTHSLKDFYAPPASE